MPEDVAKNDIRYWSDGRDYKLALAARGDEAAVVAANWPGMVDQATIVEGDATRATAFGFWSEGQVRAVEPLRER